MSRKGRRRSTHIKVIIHVPSLNEEYTLPAVLNSIPTQDGCLDEAGVFVDHAAPAPTPVVADSHRVLREWVRTQGIATFYDAGEGVCHQIMVEEGYCEPGTVIVGSDSHSNSYGAGGAFG